MSREWILCIFHKNPFFLAYNIDFNEKLLLNYKQKQNGLLIVNKKWLRYLKKGIGPEDKGHIM